MAEENELLTVKEAARMLGVSEQYVRRVLASGKLRGYRLGCFWVVRREEVALFAAERRTLHLPGVVRIRRPR